MFPKGVILWARKTGMVSQILQYINHEAVLSVFSLVFVDYIKPFVNYVRQGESKEELMKMHTSNTVDLKKEQSSKMPFLKTKNIRQALID